MKKYIYYSFASMALFFASCDDFGTTNVSPNASTVPLTSALLTNAETGLGGSSANVLDGLYVQYFSLTLYTDASRWTVQDINWGDYSASIEDLQNIININSDPATADYAALNGENNNQIAIARILKAYRMSIITDHYGDVPYFEAVKGIINPVYDDQQVIYTDLFKELKEAVAQFTDGGRPVKGDIVYGGDLTAWKKFANSFRIILAVRISEADDALGKAQVLDVLDNLDTNGGVMEETGDDFDLTYPGNSPGFSNPWFALAGDQNVAATIADFLNLTQDPRVNAYGTPVSGELVGFPFGLQRQDAIEWDNANDGNSLILSTPLRAAASTLKIVSTGDIYLARAEAAQLGWTTESVDDNYENGIAYSWDYFGLYDDDEFSAYLDRDEITLETGDALEKIQNQRWVSYYPNATQAYADWRRTGIPVLDPGPAPVNESKEIPTRYRYPTLEYGLNPVGLQAAIAKLAGGDKDSGHVWWDK